MHNLILHGLFGPPQESSVRFDAGQREDIP
jgi:hypothetical protein